MLSCILCVLFFTEVSLCKIEDLSVIVSLKQGKIRGFLDKSRNGEDFYSFLKVPYANPPIGKSRFEEPTEHLGWNGVRDATTQPPLCAQINYLKVLTESSFDFGGEEDCLFLNIFSKKIAERNLPVMVYFHGGGYVGSGIRLYGPHDLLDGDIVLVNVQYRLGLLGFLWTEDSVTPSNLGLRDQTFALKWIQNNIQAFGGDPKKVTIFGQSVGAASVHAHLLSDYSNGLFSRAIMQSGNLLCPWAKMIRPRETAIKVAEELGCFEGKALAEGIERSHQLLDCLRDMDVEKLLRKTKETFEWSFLPKRTVPHFDGDFFKEEIETMIQNGKAKRVPVMMGVNRDEGAFVSNPILLMEDQRKAIKDQFLTIGPISLALDREKDAVALSKQAYSFYVGGVKNNLENYFDLTRLYGDRHFKVCSHLAAEYHSRLQKTYFYEFQHRANQNFFQIFKSPAITNNLIMHGDELYNIFTGGFASHDQRSQNDSEVARIVSSLWLNFAVHGDPTPDDSLGFRWEAFRPNDAKYLKLDRRPKMQEDYLVEERKFWNCLPTESNKLLSKKNMKDEL